MIRNREFCEEIKSWRHYLHQHPELAFEEVETAQFVYKKLCEFGMDDIHRGLGKTGVVATLYGKGFSAKNPGKRIGLRADMDALPLEEKNDFDYVSKKKGFMHACGHDGHTAMLLGAAKYLSLSEHRTFAGTIHFIFQPAEEGAGGAQKMIDDGLFELFPVDAIFGLHNWPTLPEGTIGVTSGPIMAASDSLSITVKGQGGHAALPHFTVDPVVVASHLIVALQTISSRKFNPIDPNVLSITQINGGSAFNIIPDEVTLKGSCRTLTVESRQFMQEEIQRIAEGVAKTFGAQIDVHYRLGYPPTINSVEEAHLVSQVAATVVGENMVMGNLPPSMGAEDFSYMLLKKPGCYFWLGAGFPERGDCRIHSAHYDFNDRIIELGLKMWVGIVAAYLGIESQ